MSERSIYLRDQADKCRQHANMVGELELEKSYANSPLCTLRARHRSKAKRE